MELIKNEGMAFNVWAQYHIFARKIPDFSAKHL